jgi:hypothetical protein
MILQTISMGTNLSVHILLHTRLLANVPNVPRSRSGWEPIYETVTSEEPALL